MRWFGDTALPKLALAHRGIKHLTHPSPFGISEAQVTEVSGSLCFIHISGKKSFDPIWVYAKAVISHRAKVDWSKTLSH